MSKQNVELGRRALAAYNAKDPEGFIAYCDPQIEFHSVIAAIGGGVYHGHDGVRSWFRDFEDSMDELRLETEALFDLGENTLHFYVAHGRGRHSGAEVAMPAAQVVRWRDGLIVYSKAYLHREDALSDLGVSQETLKPL